MPKLKTNRSVKKRMRLTKSGKVKHFRAGRGHLLTLKRSKRRRNLGKPGFIEGEEAKTIKILLPYGA
jgi:large subunit ribosomal protein L35